MIDTDDIIPDGITFKNAVVVMTSVIKGDGKFFAQLFLEEALYENKHGSGMWWKNCVKKILVSEKELSGINFAILKYGLVYIKNKLIDSDDNMYLTVTSLI